MNQTESQIKSNNNIENNNNNKNELTDSSSSSKEPLQKSCFVDEPSLNSFDYSKHVKCMAEMKSKDELFKFISFSWREYIPLCFRISTSVNQELIETSVDDVLLRPLQAYMFQNDSDEFLAQLSMLDNDEPKVCGKILKTNEKIYFCQDCSRDITRIMCNDCFRQSKHRDHRYKIITSDGNGYCDCGDLDAWKQYPHCDKHSSKGSPDKQFSIDDTIKKLPADLIERTENLIQIVFNYILEIVSLEEEQLCPVPSDFSKQKSADEYILFIYLNELANSGELTNALAYTLRLDSEQANLHTELLEKHSRLAIKSGTRAECINYRNLINNRKNTDHIAKFSIIHTELVSHQFFVDKLFVWLKKLCLYSKSICYLLCRLLFAQKTVHTEDLDEQQKSQPIILKFLQRNFFIWQNAREKMYECIVTNILMDHYWKREFAIIFAQNYKSFMRSYLVNKNFSTITTLNLCVQIFPVATLSSMLLEKCNLFEIIMETFIEITNMNDDDDYLEFLKLSDKHRPDYYLAKFIMNDLGYMLINKPDEWNPDLRLNFLNGLKLYIELVKRLQGLNSVIRYTQAHIEFEPEWEKCYYFLSRLQKPTVYLLDWITSDRYVLIESFKLLFSILTELEEMHELVSMKELTYRNHVYEILSYDILVKKVSLHAHFTRFFANAYALCTQYEPIYAKINASLITNKSLVRTLIEPSIRAFSLFVQAGKCGLWKRNGSAFHNQVYLYNNIMFRNEFLDRDILCMQIGAILLDSDEFLIVLLERFNLFSYLTNHEFDTSEERNKLDPDRYEILKPMCECFLELIIYLICERYETYLSKLSKHQNEKLEREVLHVLCLEPACFSILSSKVYRDLEHYTNDIELTNVLNSIAKIKNTSNNLKTIYELKEEYYDHYNPYFYHYTNSERAKAEYYQINLRKYDPRKLIKPVKLPELTPAFNNLKHLLDSNVFMDIVHCTLHRYLMNKTNQNYEIQLIKILYLIGLALHEEYNEMFDSNNNQISVNYEFKFIEKSVNFRLNQDLIKHYLTEIIALPTLGESFTKQLTEWTLSYYKKLLEMKFKPSELINQANKLNISTGNETTKASSSSETSNTKENMKQKAEKRRAKLLNKFNQMQTQFANNNQELTSSLRLSANESTSPVPPQPTSSSQHSSLSAITTDKTEVCCLGPNENMRMLLEKNSLPKTFHCILCQEDENSFGGEPESAMILPCYVQHSRVLGQQHSPMKQTKTSQIFKLKNNLSGPFTSTCGHAMHAECWTKFTANLSSARSAVLNREELNENWCPLCEAICNCVLSIFPSQMNYNDATEKELKHDSNNNNNEDHYYSFEAWFDQMRNSCHIESFENSVNSLNLNEKKEEISSLKAYSPTINHLVNEFARNTFNFGSELNDTYLNNNENLCASIASNCSYTIQVIDQLLAIDKQHQLSLKQENLLANLVKQSNATIKSKNIETDHNLRQLFALLFGPESSEATDESNVSSALIDIDVFHYLVLFTLSSTSVDAHSRLFMFKLMLQLQSLQILINYITTNNLSKLMSVNDDQFTSLPIYLIQRLKLSSVIKEKNNANNNDSGDVTQMIKSLKESLMPFLRCSVMFYCFLNEIAQSIELADFIQNDLNDFDKLIVRLGLSPVEFNELVFNLNNNKSLNYLTERITLLSGANEFQLIEYPFKMKEFVSLPHDYVDLIAMSSSSLSSTSVACTSVNETEHFNIMCLICGEMIVKRASHHTTNQVKYEIFNRPVGECTAHALRCGSNIGVFLKIDECKILLLQLKLFFNEKKGFECRGCTIAAPYLDSYGETDQNFLKGNPLFLSQPLYRKLYLEWVSHAIPYRVFSYNQNRSSINIVDMSSY